VAPSAPRTVYMPLRASSLYKDLLQYQIKSIKSNQV